MGRQLMAVVLRDDRGRGKRERRFTKGIGDGLRTKGLSGKGTDDNNGTSSEALIP